MMKSKKKKSGVRKVSFEYFAPEAKKVGIAGSFNDWDPSKTLLKKNSQGMWRLELKLKPGRYEYRFRVDEHWQNDQRPVECIPNPFGSWNCLLTVQ